MIKKLGDKKTKIDAYFLTEIDYLIGHFLNKFTVDQNSEGDLRFLKEL